MNQLFGAFDLDFSARSTGAGIDAHGRARLTQTSLDPNQEFSGEVTCLRVVGATATIAAAASIGVKLTKVPPGSPLQSMIIFATDGGKFSGAPDTATFFFSTGPPPPDGACPTPFAGSPVADGEVVIHNTLP